MIEAGSGGAALEVLDEQPAIDLMLLDFAMPGMNGAEVAEEVRRGGPPCRSCSSPATPTSTR